MVWKSLEGKDSRFPAQGLGGQNLGFRVWDSLEILAGPGAREERTHNMYVQHAPGRQDSQTEAQHAARRAQRAWCTAHPHAAGTERKRQYHEGVFFRSILNRGERLYRGTNFPSCTSYIFLQQNCCGAGLLLLFKVAVSGIFDIGSRSSYPALEFCQIPSFSGL